MPGLSVQHIRAAVRSGSATCVSVAEQCLNRIVQEEARVRAFNYLELETALDQARSLDKTSTMSRLHGLPIGIKDIIDTADMPTAYGSPIYASNRPSEDAACVSALKQAGACILGKTVSTEFAVFHPGKTRNPHNLERTPGGSSSGSAAAVASGMVPAALGTQTAGSVIRPAAFCGVVGYKPSYGAIETAGVHPLAPSFDTVGLFTRSIADTVAVASVLIAQLPDTLVAPSGTKIGFLRTPWWSQAETPYQQSLAQLTSGLAKAGAHMTEVSEITHLNTVNESQDTIMWYEASQSLAGPLQSNPGLLSKGLREKLLVGQTVTEANITEAHAQISRARDAVHEQFSDIDVIMVPSAPGEAPPIATTGDPVFNRAWTALGLPAITVPCGKGPNGLPYGVQLIGRLGDDKSLLQHAAWVEGVLTQM